MSTPIKINKGLKAKLPESIVNGQINFCTDTGELYIDDATKRTIISSTYYGKTETNAETQVKIISIDSFSLKASIRIIIEFTEGNSASNPQLNINNTGAKDIVYGGTNNKLELLPGVLYDFVYNGTQYILIGNSASGENVLQIENTNNFEYPLLASNVKADVSMGNYYNPTVYNSTIKMNPSTGTITATNFNGIATNATSDANGNEITATYATKEELSNATSIIIRRWTE